VKSRCVGRCLWL